MPGRGTYWHTALASREAVRDPPDLLARFVRVFRLTPAAFIRWGHARGQLSQQAKAALHALLQNLPDHRLPPTTAAEP